MRSSLAVAVLAAIAHADQIVTDATRVYKGAFGAITEEIQTPTGLQKSVTFPSVPYHMNYEAQASNLEYLTQKMKGTVSNDEPLYTCDERIPRSETQMLNFLPVYDAAVNADMPHASFKGTCWDFDVTYE